MMCPFGSAHQGWSLPGERLKQSMVLPLQRFKIPGDHGLVVMASPQLHSSTAHTHMPGGQCLEVVWLFTIPPTVQLFNAPLVASHLQL